MDEVKEILNESLSLILQELTKLDVKILTHYRDQEKYHVLCDNIILTYKELTGELNLSFHVSLMPDESAFVACSLQELDCISEITIGDVFITDEQGNIISGDECIKKFEQQVKYSNYSEFMEEENQNFILHNGQCGMEC